MESAISVKIESLSFPPETKEALRDIDLTIKKGDFIAITGGVASGKSALLHCITGAIPKYHEGQLNGTIEVLGKNILDIPLPKMSNYIGYMMQDPQSQIVDVDVDEEVAFGVGNMGFSIEEIDLRVKEALAYVDLEGFGARKTDALSGGQAQRVVLAGVLAMDAPILILDQPTAELDPKGRRDLYSHLARLNKEKNVTVVLVMDRAEEVLAYANDVIIMKEGTVSRQCTPAEFMKLSQGKNQDKTESRIKNGETIVSVNGAAYTYKGGFTGCLPVNLKIARGEFITLVGLNGSGKTTLLKMIEGLLLPSQGSIELFSQKMTKTNANELRRKIGFLFQNPDYQIFADTVLKEVTFSLRLQKLPVDEVEARGEEALLSMGLLKYKDLHPQRLSRGQRQLLALASVLINNPELIIADEPTSGLDEDQSHEILKILKSLVNQGKTVVLVSHDINLAKIYSHRLIAMYRHEVVADFSVDALSDYLTQLASIGLLKGVST